MSQCRYASDITVLWSASADTSTMCNAILSAAQAEPLAMVIIWFSADRHDASDIVDMLAAGNTSLRYCGCSTSGEITPDGMQENGFVAVTLPARWFDCTTTVLNKVASLGMETIAHRCTATRKRFLGAMSSPPGPGHLFAISLIDGLSYAEEPVTVAIDRGLDGIPLVGGSAGDNLEFKTTRQISSGQSYSQACVLLLIHCRLPCRVYTNNNFVPTDHKLVVTEADPDKRRVMEFNAENAAIAYADAIGLKPAELDAGSFASHSVIVRFGGQYYCRSIQKINEDGSLTFFCAIDTGLVLTVANSVGMVASSRQQINALEQDIGPIDLLFGFDCVYRKLDAQRRGTTHKIATLYQEKNFIGFNTYGEQYGSMHVNQTFTGVAIGMPPEEISKN